jgi:quercetin dioxygenase-like cupin family protein
MTSERREELVGVEDGETITALERREVVILVERPDITITWSRYGPGERGPDLHVHRAHTDAFYVLEGELTFAVGPEGISVPAGRFVAVPPDVVHTFSNEGSAEARWLNLHAPEKGFAAYLRAARDGTDAVFDSFDPHQDGGRPAAEAIVTGPGEGERVVSGDRVGFLKGVVPELCVAEWVVDGPFEAPDPHPSVDLYFVLEGELDVTVDGSVHAAGAGTLASMPLGSRRTFAPRGDGKARILSVHAPDAGLADLLTT